MFKWLNNTILGRIYEPAYTWIIELMYVCFLLNHTYNSGINGIPITKAKGFTADDNCLLRFSFCKPVYYKVDVSDF